MTKVDVTSSVTPKAPALGSWFFIAGFLGLLAAFVLTIEKLHSLVNPDSGASCDFSVIVQCSANLGSEQGSVFGFPNPLIGLMAWPFVLASGFIIVNRVRISQLWWWGFLAGMLFAVGFTSWLQYQSIMVLGTLCPWCMVTWFAVIPTFVGTLVYMGRVDVFSERCRSFFDSARLYIPVVSLLWMAGIALWAQWRLDWVSLLFL